MDKHVTLVASLHIGYSAWQILGATGDPSQQDAAGGR